MAVKNANDVIKVMGEYYAKLPNLPKGVNDFIVSVTPWLSLVFGVLLVLVSLSAFGLGAVLSPFAAVNGGVGVAVNLMIAAVVGIVEGVLMVVAFAPLRKRLVRGWTLLFFVEALSALGAVLSLSVSGVVGVLIAYYFLYQIRSYYK